MGNCSTNCNPCGPSYEAINQLATKAGAYARQANTYATNAENSWLEFNALYLGAFATEPTVDNEGQPLQVGALYWNSVTDQLFAWEGASWILATGFNQFTTFIATGRSAARNLVTRESDYVNVKDFGAVGNGSDDDTTAIRNAIGSGFRTVYFPAGDYLITDTITITGGDTILFGDGPRTQILLNDPAKDIIHIKPPVGSTGEILRCGLFFLNLFNTNTSTGSISSPRTGAGLRLTRGGWCNFNNILVRNCPEGIICEGGQNNTFEQIHLWPIGTGYVLPPKSSQITFKGFLQNGQYFHCNNTKLLNFTASTGNQAGSYEHCIKIQSSDGIIISNGNVSHGGVSQVLIEVDTPAGVITGLPPYISALKFSNVYFDSSIRTTGPRYNIYFPQNTLSHRRIYSTSISNCTLANSNRNGIFAEEPIYDLIVDGCDIQGSTETGIVLTNATVAAGRDNFAKTIINGNNFSFINLDDISTVSSIDFGYQANISIIGNNFGEVKQCAIRARGSSKNISITGNAFWNTTDSTFSDFVKESGFFVAEPYVVSGNSSNSIILSNSLNGFRSSNKNVSDVNTLDWYEEQTITPVLNFGGATTGITYASQQGFTTRIGNFVNFTFRIALTSKGSSTGSVAITGLPFNTTNLPRTACSVAIGGILNTITEQVIAEFVWDGVSERNIQLFKIVSGAKVALTNADFTNATDFSVSGVYRV